MHLAKSHVCSHINEKELQKGFRPEGEISADGWPAPYKQGLRGLDLPAVFDHQQLIDHLEKQPHLHILHARLSHPKIQ